MDTGLIERSVNIEADVLFETLHQSMQSERLKMSRPGNDVRLE
jgi:hypothetical protein